MKVVFLSLNLFLFIPYTNYIYKHQLNSVDFAKKTGLLIFRGKKAKFRGIFRGKFAEKSADFAGFSRGKKVEIRTKKK